MDTLYRSIWLLTWLRLLTEGSVVAPPWTDSSGNPCASKPNGWQLLYWPGDGQCYRIFQKGYPCPESMELTPGKNGSAECNCPPGTALYPRDAVCYKLHKQGPCLENEYFGPVKTPNKRSQGHRWGACFEIEECEEGEVFWPKEGKCYRDLTKGPCPEGLLLKEREKFGECSCSNETMSTNYWEPGMSCHEHFSQGPCDFGQVFLTNGTCGCDQFMKEYHHQSKKCYAIGSRGPCKEGHVFKIVSDNRNQSKNYSSECGCQHGHVLWPRDGKCYYPFSRGPCDPGQMLEVNYSQVEPTLSCIELPCTIGQLYFPGGKGCHKVGTKGPCPSGQVVHYQNISPSAEISYLGVCGCPSLQDDESSFFTQLSDSNQFRGNCSNPDERKASTGKQLKTHEKKAECGIGRSLVEWKDGRCWQLYSQGPCSEGEWLVPDRGKGQREGRGWRNGKCECRPGYTTNIDSKNQTICIFNSEAIVKMFATRL